MSGLRAQCRRSAKTSATRVRKLSKGMAVAGTTALEPAISDVTGLRPNRRRTAIVFPFFSLPESR